MGQDATILICCHKHDYCYHGDGFFPIQVGKAVSSLDLPMQGDDEGDNISAMTPYYCELTAHYWYWKNRPHTRYVGLCHYRRYFDFAHPVLPLRNVRIVPQSAADGWLSGLPDLDKVFSRYDIVLAKRKVYPLSLRYDYAMYHIVNDISILEEVIAELTPEYSKAFDEVINCGNRLSHFNMFITRDIVFEEYSEWLFTILEEVGRRICISGYKDQARVFGYLAERLLNVYVRARKLKVKYVPVVKVSDAKEISPLEDCVTTLRSAVVSQFFILPKKLRKLLKG